MIVMLTGTLVEALPTHVVLQVGGVGYELGVSSTTATSLPAQGAETTLYVRMVVRDSAIELFGFATKDERLVFDRLVGVSGVGPRLALSVLSTFTPGQLAVVVRDADTKRMSEVSGVGKKTASRLVLELADAFSKDPVLRQLTDGAAVPSGSGTPAAADDAAVSSAVEALLSMGFTQQEADLAVEGVEETGARTVEAVLAYALRRLGGRS